MHAWQTCLLHGGVGLQFIIMEKHNKVGRESVVYIFFYFFYNRVAPIRLSLRLSMLKNIFSDASTVLSSSEASIFFFPFPTNKI
jgi:succinate dehydrogenase hydrophobic anchor subunit